MESHLRTTMKASEAVKLSNQGKEDLINRYRKQNKKNIELIYSEIAKKCKDGGRMIRVYWRYIDEASLPMTDRISIELINTSIDHIAEVLIHDGYRIKKEHLDRMIKIEW